jgi:hypothetical protein
MESKSESGASMLEVLCYLSLIVVMSVGTLQVYVSESRKADRIRIENQIYDIIDKVQVFEFGNKDTLNESGIKNKLTGAGISLHHKWSAGDSENSIQITASGMECFGVAVSKLPQHACIHLASQIKSECKTTAGTLKTMKIVINDKNVDGKFDDGIELCEANDSNKVTIYANKN